jgi:uncharacterized protein with von Willebrand factor type A (vWA) domain
MLDRVIEFTRALRDAGIPVSVSEDLDALKALEHLEPTSPDVLRASLATTTLKSERHRAQFDSLFDIYFRAHPGAPETAGDATDPSEHADDLFEGLMGTGGEGGEGGLQGLASRAVERFGRVEDSPSDSLYFEYPVFRALDLDALRARAEEAFEGMSPLEALAARRGFEQRVARFREHIRTEVRRRVAHRKGPETVTRHAVRPLPEDADLMSIGPDDSAALRKAIRPLARKLATRIAMKRRRSNRGALDVRRTVRHSLSTGGVPFDTYLRRRAPHRPELFLLCDVSDSVARFSRFSLMLVHALSMQFSRVRSFVFIDTLDEATRFFEHEDFLAAVDRMKTEAEVVNFDGHSDYGSSLERFLEDYGRDVTGKTTLLILGDARNNFRAARTEALEELKQESHRTYWLNPEPVMFWDTGDSIASVYGACVDDMVEVRNLRQLEEFIARRL